MKKLVILLLVLCVVTGVLSAQSSVKGISANGTTGLMTTPTARIGWERLDFGLDIGYSFLSGGGDNTTHIPRVTLSLFRKAEIAVAYATDLDKLSGFMLNGKFQFYKEGGSALAMGLDYSTYDWGSNAYVSLLRPYIVTTYSGRFFNSPAITSMTLGWDLDRGNGLEFDNFNYSMGFEMSLFPQYFKNYIYWMSDFANYDFSAYGGATGVRASSRGIFNTGIRIDPIKDSQYKFVIDVVGTDLLDSNRGFMMDVTFGFAL